MAGSGEQQERTTSFRRAMRGEWTDALLCALMPAACAWEELSTTSSEYAKAAQDAAAGAAAGAVDGAVEVLGAAAEPLAQAAEIARWGAIALAVVLGLVVVLLLVVAWVYWGPAVKSALAGVGKLGAAVGGA